MAWSFLRGLEASSFEVSSFEVLMERCKKENLMASASAAGPLASGLEGGWCCIERRESRRSKLLHDSLRGWKTCQNGIKIVQKSAKIQSKSTKNPPKVDPGGVWGPFGLPRSVLEPIWTPVGVPLGVDFEAKWGSCWGHVGSKIDFRRPQMAFKINNEV